MSREDRGLVGNTKETAQITTGSTPVIVHAPPRALRGNRSVVRKAMKAPT